MSSTTIISVLNVLTVVAIQVQAPALRAVPDGVASINSDAGDDAAWCGTHHTYRWRSRAGRQGRARGGCPFDGACDDPVLRDASIPSASTAMTTISAIIHVFCENDGSNCAVTQAQVDDEIATVNANHLPWRIRFIHETHFVSDTEFRFFVWPDEEIAMKTTYADSPASKLNIYVVRNAGGFSFAVFPWEAVALTSLGGVVLDDRGFDQLGKITTHEVGHALGLWHTRHGTVEEPEEFLNDPCLWPCYERADGTDADVTGDRCSDTPPTPFASACDSPGGVDDCSDTPWGVTDFENFMDNALVACPENHFTPQQGGRMNCWTEDALNGWLTNGANIPATSVWGAAVLSLALLSAGTLIMKRSRSTF